MTLQDLGSLGEFIAAVGLMFSLIFVGWEIRKTRRQVVVEGTESRLNLFNELNRLLLTHPDLRDVWVRGSGDHLRDLSEDDGFVFDQLMTLRCTIFVRMFVRGTELKDRESLDVARASIRDWFSYQPSAGEWWRRHRKAWRVPFREFVDEILRDQEQASA